MSLKIVVLAKQVPDTRNVGKDAMNADGTTLCLYPICADSICTIDTSTNKRLIFLNTGFIFRTKTKNGMQYYDI